jgi:hypothetical protein
MSDREPRISVRLDVSIQRPPAPWSPALLAELFDSAFGPGWRKERAKAVDLSGEQRDQLGDRVEHVPVAVDYGFQLIASVAVRRDGGDDLGDFAVRHLEALRDQLERVVVWCRDEAEANRSDTGEQA